MKPQAQAQAASSRSRSSTGRMDKKEKKLDISCKFIKIQE
jgi:hypothetical protein